jgi:hypothetical protein
MALAPDLRPSTRGVRRPITRLRVTPMIPVTCAKVLYILLDGRSFFFRYFLLTCADQSETPELGIRPREDPPGRFDAKTTIGLEWFHQLQCALVIHFCGPDWLDFLHEIGRRARGCSKFHCGDSS